MRAACSDDAMIWLNEKPCGIQAGVRTRISAAAPASAAVAYDTGSCGVVSGSTLPKIASGLMPLEPKACSRSGSNSTPVNCLTRNRSRNASAAACTVGNVNAKLTTATDAAAANHLRRLAAGAMRAAAWGGTARNLARNRAANSGFGSTFRSRRNWSSIETSLPIAAQRLHHAMQDRAHIRFAQTRELGDGAVRGFGTVLQRDELLLAWRKLLEKLTQAGEIRLVRYVLVRGAFRGDVFRRLQRQMRPLRAQMIRRDVARDADQPRREAREIAPISRSRGPRFLERARRQVFRLRVVADAVAEEVVDARQLLCIHRIPIGLGGDDA